MFAQGKKQLETREIIKILSHPCYPRNFDFHGNEAKKIKMANSKKLSFSKSPILNIFVKISWIGPWVSSID